MPATSAAFLSNRLKPGIVLRVRAGIALEPVPETTRFALAQAVATPDIRPRALSAVLSTPRMLVLRPVISATIFPDEIFRPSFAFAAKTSFFDSNRKWVAYTIAH